MRRFRKKIEKIDFKHGIYPPFTLEAGRLRAATFITCIGSEALDILVYPVNQDIRGFCFASKEEKGRIDKNLSFLADVFLGFIQNMKEICCFVLFAHNDKK